MPATPETDGFGAILACADFNRDGFDDIAVGFARDFLGGRLFAGSVVILPGSGSGTTLTGATRFDQDTPGIPDSVEQNDEFGSALAAGDITGDGYPDLVVSTNTEGFSETSDNRGASITVLRGSSHGLTTNGVQYWTQLSAGVPGSDDPLAFFGGALLYGDFNHDGYGDIAVGSPNENVGGVDAAGAITIFRGNAGGLTTTGITRLAWDTPGMPAAAVGFSLGLVMSSLRQPDGGATLVVGQRYATINGFQRAGAVLLLPGQSPGGVTLAGVTTLSTLDAGVTPQAFANFGQALG
jgi:hypothetical protein